jgi:multidrug efflux pump subunit AcrA (membrane-fusion protein)
MNRQVTIVLGAVVIVAGIGISMFLTSKAEPPAKTDLASLVPEVLVKQIELDTVDNKIEISGKLMADQRVELFSEVQGVLLPSNKVFKEGVTYGQNEVMLRIDSTEYYLNLMATKSSYLNKLVQLGPDIKYDFPEAYDGWNTYVSSIDVKDPLKELPNPTNQKHRNFLTSRDIYSQYYQIKSQEEKLKKYNIKAPFTGVLSEGNLQPGTMIRLGQKLGTFIQPSSFELETAVSINQAKSIVVGDKVNLRSASTNESWQGSVKRISSQLDKATQTIKVYVSVQDSELKEGMFLIGEILSHPFNNAIEIQRNLLIGTNQVYVLQDSTLVLTPIEVLKLSESTAVIQGLSNNTIVLNQVFSGAYNGLKVSPKHSK